MLVYSCVYVADTSGMCHVMMCLTCVVYVVCMSCGHTIRWGISECVECVGGCACACVCGMCGNLHGICMVHVICANYVWCMWWVMDICVGGTYLKFDFKIMTGTFLCRQRIARQDSVQCHLHVRQISSSRYASLWHQWDEDTCSGCLTGWFWDWTYVRCTSPASYNWDMVSHESLSSL